MVAEREDELKCWLQEVVIILVGDSGRVQEEGVTGGGTIGVGKWGSWKGVLVAGSGIKGRWRQEVSGEGDGRG